VKLDRHAEKGIFARPRIGAGRACCAATLAALGSLAYFDFRCAFSKIAICPA